MGRDDRKDDRSSRKDRGSDRDRERRRRRRSPSYDSSESDSDDSYSSRDSSPPRRSRKSRGAYSDDEDSRRGRDRRRNRDYYHDEPSPSPTRKNVVEDMLAAVGLLNAKNKIKKKARGDRDDDDDDNGKSKEEKKAAQKQALQAALTAAAVEAFRSRNEPGGLTAERLMRIAGAAIAAGGVDVLVDRNPNQHGMRHIVESVVAGLAAGKTIGPQVKHKRPGPMMDKVGGGMIGMATRQILSRSMSRSAKKRK